MGWSCQCRHQLSSAGTIDVYGRPDGGLVERLRQKAEMLGSGTVRVHDFHAGFARLPRVEVRERPAPVQAGGPEAAIPWSSSRRRGVPSREGIMSTDPVSASRHARHQYWRIQGLAGNRADADRAYRFCGAN